VPPESAISTGFCRRFVSGYGFSHIVTAEQFDGFEPLKVFLEARQSDLDALEAAKKSPFMIEKRPRGLKPALIRVALRGPEGPLFHGRTGVRDFFRNLLSRIHSARLAARVELVPFPISVQASDRHA
jgi:hypothetical protein